MNVEQQLMSIALSKGLRETTVVSYHRLLARLGILDQEVAQITREVALEALWTLDNPNTRRATVIALRSVLGLPLRIPRGVPRRYDLPDEDTLRLALMTSPHEIRGLLMLYAGLRIGEACAVTSADVAGDRLRVDKQVVEIHRTGRPTTVRIGPVKTTEAEVVIPWWLSERLASTGEYSPLTKPSSVRESLRRAGRKVGIDLNPHLLRHAYATMLLAKGVPLIVVSRQLRHSDIATTLRTYAQGDSAESIHKAFG